MANTYHNYIAMQGHVPSRSFIYQDGKLHPRATSLHVNLGFRLSRKQFVREESHETDQILTHHLLEGAGGNDKPRSTCLHEAADCTASPFFNDSICHCYVTWVH